MEKTERDSRIKNSSGTRSPGMQKTHIPLLPEVHQELVPRLLASEKSVQAPNLCNPPVTLLCWVFLICSSKGMSLVCHWSDGLRSPYGLTATEKNLLRCERLSNVMLKHPLWITVFPKNGHVLPLKTPILWQVSCHEPPVI